MEHILHHLDQPVFKRIAEYSAHSGVRAYLVGGYVRDLLIGRDSKDIDIVVIGSGPDYADKFAETLPGFKKLSLFRNFGTANLQWKGIELEFVGARKESYSRDSRNPIVEDGTLEDDLSRRDFTINALAISLNADDFGNIIDLFNGLDDLDARLLRTPLDPDITYSDDPLRMMRAIRFASQLGFSIVEESLQSIQYNAERIGIISQERITDELNKIILSKIPSLGFKLLHQTELLVRIFPEFTVLEGVKTVDNRGHKDNFYHTLQVLDNVARESNDLWLRWAAILHDIGKPATQRYDPEIGWTFHGHEVVGARMVTKIFRKLKLPQHEAMKFVEKLVLLHLRPIALTNDVTDAAIRRLIVDVGEDRDALMTLCRADITSKNMDKVRRYLARFDEVVEKIYDVEERDALRNWKPPITGEMIMEAFNLKPGRQVGEIKNQIADAILNGDIPNDYEAAYGLMIRIGTECGLEVRED